LARHDGRPVKKILVSFGGTDPNNATSIALGGLDRFADDFLITVAISSRASHLDEIRHRMRGQMQLALDADMAALMADADLAIGAAGASAYERAVLGLPSILITVAENQRALAQLMIKAGAAVGAGNIDSDIVERLQSLVRSLIERSDARIMMSNAASALIDGRGAQRVVLMLADVAAAIDGAEVRLRLADAGDEEWLLELQRQPETRRYSRNPAIPSAQEHHRWMERTLADSRRLLLVIERSGSRVGMARLDSAANNEDVERYEISIALDSRYHGWGIAGAALGVIRCLKPQAELDAVVLKGNQESRALFLRSGYIPITEERYRGYPRE